MSTREADGSHTQAEAVMWARGLSLVQTSSVARSLSISSLSRDSCSLTGT